MYCEVDVVPIKIIIADDHALLRQGIRNVLELEEDLIVIGEAGDGEQAVQQAAELMPDILLLDINMPKMNGIEFLRNLRKNKGECSFNCVTSLIT